MCQGRTAHSRREEREQAQENLGSLGWSLTAEQVAALDAASDSSGLAGADARTVSFQTLPRQVECLAEALRLLALTGKLEVRVAQLPRAGTAPPAPMPRPRASPAPSPRAASQRSRWR